MTYDSFLTLLPHLVFFLNPCLRKWFGDLHFLNHWFYTIFTLSQGNFFSCIFPSFSLPLFHPSVTSISGIKIRENKLLDFAGSSSIYKTVIGEFYVIYYLTINNF
jgi:hypothetical protein